MYLSNFQGPTNREEPIVLVLQLDHHAGLTIVRALGMAGIYCLGVSYEGMSYGCYSKHLRGFAAFNPKDECDRIEKTLELINLVKPAFVMAISESLLQRLNSYRESLSKVTKLLFAQQEILDGAFNKANAIATAKSLGIPVPASYSPEEIIKLGKVPEDVQYPLVLKPPLSYAQSPWGQYDFRYKYCFSSLEVLETLLHFQDAPYLPLVQEYCPGKGVGIELCMYRGKAVAAFQHQRIREMPPSGGASVMRKSVPLSQGMYADSVRLLQSLHWEGVAMVEFRYDRNTKRYWLMEINGRFWGSLCLPIVCGVNFPLILLETMGLGLQPSRVLEEYPYDRHCRQLSADIHWLWKVLCTRKNELPLELRKSKVWIVAQFFYDFLRLPYHDIEWMDDFLPAIHFWKERLINVISVFPSRGRISLIGDRHGN